MTKKDYFPGNPMQTKPLQPSNPVPVTIDQEHDEQVVQYEFYIPAKIWDHSAVKDFREKLGKISVGATIFKGTTGIWKSPNKWEKEEKEVVEDTHIYRLIKGEIPDECKGEDDRSMSGKDYIRANLRGFIEKMMLELSVWDESKQEEFLFTETEIFNNLAKLK